MRKRYSIAYPIVIFLFLSGCSYYDGKLALFDLTDENRKHYAHRQAEARFWASVRPKTNLSEAHYRLGLHYQQMGEYDKSIREFRKALRNDRSYCKAYNGIAMTYDLQKRCEPAFAAYEEAVECAPDAAYAYNNYACSSLLCGDYEKGFELLQKAASLAADDTRITNNLRIARAISIRESISELLPPAEAPLPSAGMEPAPAPVPAQPAGPEAPCLAGPAAMEPPAPSGNPVALAMHEDHKKTGQQSLAPAGTPEISEKRTSAPPAPVAAEDSDTENDNLMPSPSFPIPVHAAIEISNGNGTTGMAKRSAEFLRDLGFAVRSITNARHFRFAESVILYKDEYLQDAKDIAAVIPGAQNLERVEALEKSWIGVKVILGRDLAAARFPEIIAELAQEKLH